jgi:hypothetical protein
MSDKEKSPWNSLEIVKLVVGLLTPLFLFLIGHMVSDSVRRAEDSRKELEAQRQLSETRRVAIQAFSRFIYERRVRAELLASALRRNAEKPVDASIDELVRRKQLYDEAYVSWNANHQANLLLVRQVLDAGDYSEFESIVEFRLVKQVFAPLDTCLTRAYDHAIRGGDPRPDLESCQTADLLQRALDCGYAITDELFKIAGIDKRNIRQAGSIIDERCPEN